MSTPTIICSVFALIAMIVLLSIRKQCNGAYQKCIWRGAFIFFVAYLLILSTVSIRWKYFISPERIADTARNFAFLSGAFISAIISILVVSIDLTLTYLKIKKLKNS